MIRALLIGVNKYIDSRYNLRGCVGDAYDMWRLLNEVYGLSPASIVVKTDERATYDNILNSFRELLKRTRNGDVAIFYFSGHGSQINDFSNDESDNLDEVVIPHDFSWVRPLTDDIIHEIITNYLQYEASLYILMDCCHSGTITRDMIMSSAWKDQADLCQTNPFFPNYNQNRFIMPPLEAMVKTAFTQNEIKKFVSPYDDVPQDHVLLTAAAADQTASEIAIQGIPRGVFTFSLTKMLRNTPTIEVKDIGDSIIKMVKSFGMNQTPQVEFPKNLANKLIFT